MFLKFWIQKSVSSVAISSIFFCSSFSVGPRLVLKLNSSALILIAVEVGWVSCLPHDVFSLPLTQRVGHDYH